MCIKATTFSFCPCCTFYFKLCTVKRFIPGRRGCSLLLCLLGCGTLFILTFLQVVSVDFIYLLSLKSKQFNQADRRFWLGKAKSQVKVIIENEVWWCQRACVPDSWVEDWGQWDEACRKFYNKPCGCPKPSVSGD